MTPNDDFWLYIYISHHIVQNCRSRYFGRKSIFCDFHEILMMTVLVAKMHEKVQKSCKILKMYSLHPQDASKYLGWHLTMHRYEYNKFWKITIFCKFVHFRIFHEKCTNLQKMMFCQNLEDSYLCIVRDHPRYSQASLGCQEYIFSILHDFCTFLCIFVTKMTIIKISWKSQKIDFWPKYRL